MRAEGRFDRLSRQRVSLASHVDEYAQLWSRSSLPSCASLACEAAHFPTSWSSPVSKRTFQPNNRRRAKVHGFRTRMRTRAGRAVVSSRRRKGRRVLTA